MATFHQISSQNLECPICLTLFNQPKLLSCSHTFCKDCLERVFQTTSFQNIVTCPVCRKGINVPSGDVDKLQTNIPLSSLVDEVKTKSPTCSVCDTEENPLAVSYCQDCEDYMCTSCEKDHSNWKRVSNHAVVTMKDMVSGKIPLKTRRKCKTHPNKYKEYFCHGCQEYVCFRCGMLDHYNHGLVEASIQEEKVMTDTKDLKKRTSSKKATAEKYLESIQSQRKKLTDLMRKLNDDIDETYNECMKLLSERQKALKCQVGRWFQNFEKELQVMAEESLQTITQINAFDGLIGNGQKVPLEQDAILAHDTLCKNLESILGRDEPNDQSPRGVTERAQRISFRKHVKVDDLCLGNMEGHPWDLKADVEPLTPNRSAIEFMTAVPDGRIAIGQDAGKGISLYSSSGEFQETVLYDVKTRRIAFLSDGRCVV
ncbi:tripartite motif-containing protein 2-like [Diadema antillarum]|uniref:tripartite motif-containing protein 2-like n=1 Tax=Diadema antillarum TaxID=105358 RepID=UPI003A845D9A